MSDRAVRFVLKPIVFALSLVPAIGVVWVLIAGFSGLITASPPGWLIESSPNPLSDVTNATGVWTLRFLCITLAMTPLRRISGWNALVRFRRMAGLFAFFYGTLHFAIYAVADRFAGLDFPDGIVAFSTLRNLAKSVGEDIYKRPFITIGFTAWLTMVPLALTSTAGMIRRLGGRNWNRLHRLVYATAALGVVHYWWLVKADISRPRAYGVVVAALLLFRVWWVRARRPRAVVRV